MEVYDRVEERISRRTRLYTSPGEESGNGTDGKVGIVHGSVEPAKRHTHTLIGLLIVDKRKESYTSARRTETCVAPRHEDASRDFFLFVRALCFIFILFPPNEQHGGEGLCCQTSFFLFACCSVSHARDWPRRKVVFFRIGNQYAECDTAPTTMGDARKV